MATQTLVLGDHLYTVTIGPYATPGPTGALNSGSIAARADVTVSTIFHLPEPSAFVLATVGAACGLALTRWRRRTKLQAIVNGRGRSPGRTSHTML